MELQQSKFVNYIQTFLAENGLPPMPAINTPNTSTSSVSSIDKAVDEDPNVVNAKKKAVDTIALELKKKAGTITNP